MLEKSIKISNCIDCQNHDIINDGDPDDWFCDDDVAVVCTKAKNQNRNPASRYISDHSPHRTITTSCRPHHIRQESNIPDWCPL